MSPFIRHHTMSTSHWHSYHMVDPRPWPLTASLGAGIITMGFVKFIHHQDAVLLVVGIFIMGLTASQWWRDIHREASYQGHHTGVVQWGMRWGIALFIISEVLFFFSFFWAYFHMRLSPVMDIGLSWPPVGVQPFNAFSIPLLNTTILLTSGLTVTWSHHAIMAGHFSTAVYRLGVTVLLGVYFTIIQAYEYVEASFTMADSVYGSCFFVATGFHGLHVLIGSTFLVVTLIRLMGGGMSTSHHFGFEAAAWYWHFVDVVWVFLFISVYWWGGE